MKYKNLTIIGTSHISKQSIKQVKETILKIKPDITAIELDKQRFLSLIQNKKSNIKNLQSLGFKTFLLNLIGSYLQKKLGKIVKTEPGSDMKAAITTAKEIKSKIALIDQPVNITLQKLTKIPFKEKMTFIKDIFKDLFSQNKIQIDLSKVPPQSLITKLIKKLKDDYPYIHSVLVEERNHIMAKNLYNLMQTNKTIVAVVGAGHQKDIIKIIKCYSQNQK
jgi:pheromone shutdown-related protein TraB